jgi:hypothetical protein
MEFQRRILPKDVVEAKMIDEDLAIVNREVVWSR